MVVEYRLHYNPRHRRANICDKPPFVTFKLLWCHKLWMNSPPDSISYMMNMPIPFFGTYIIGSGTASARSTLPRRSSRASGNGSALVRTSANPGRICIGARITYSSTSCSGRSAPSRSTSFRKAVLMYRARNGARKSLPSSTNW